MSACKLRSLTNRAAVPRSSGHRDSDSSIDTTATLSNSLSLFSSFVVDLRLVAAASTSIALSSRGVAVCEERVLSFGGGLATGRGRGATSVMRAMDSAAAALISGDSRAATLLRRAASNDTALTNTDELDDVAVTEDEDEDDEEGRDDSNIPETTAPMARTAPCTAS